MAGNDAASRPGVRERDEGSAMLLALVVLLLGSTIVATTLTYASTVMRTRQTYTDRTERTEAAKAGLRIALSDPASLFRTCATAGLTVSVQLADAGLSTPTTTRCVKLSEARSSRPGTSRIAVATLQAGSRAPSGVTGTTYAGSGASNTSAWQADATPAATDGKIWTPNLPARVEYRRSGNGWRMPSGFPSCTVYFPGTYTSAITLTGSTPVYFTSGVYYFENVVRISGNAKVVVGNGTTPGCASDQEAAFYAVNSPSVHGITGAGATFVFGKQGRLVVDTASNGSSTSLVFNDRYSGTTDPEQSVVDGVSVMTVNGSSSGSGLTSLLLSTLSVPSSVVGTGGTSAITAGYSASAHVPSLPLSPSDKAVVELNLTDARPVTVRIPGEIAAPMGLVAITTSTAAAAASKDVQLTGGVVAAQLNVSTVRPAVLTLGLVASIVQRTFKITTVAPGQPGAIANAVVQVNQNGAFAINSWEVR